MLKYIFKLDLITILYMIIAPISAIFTIGLAYIMQMILNTAIKNDISEFPKVLVISVSYILISTFMDYAYKLLRALKLKNIMENLRNDISSKLLDKDINSFNKYEDSYFDNIFLNDMPHIENSYFHVILYGYYEFISFFVSLFLIIDINFYLAVFVILLCSIQLSIPYISGKFSSKLVASSSSFNEKYISNIKEIIQGFEIIKTFNLENNTLKNNFIVNKENQSAKFKSKNFNTIVNSISFLFGEMMYVGTLLLSSVFVILGKLPVGAILASSQLMVYITSPLMSFSNTISQIKSSKSILDKMRDILNKSNEHNENLKEFEFNNCIELRDINFVSSENHILKNINFTIEKNKKYIFIGDSGSGKSSIINTLLNIIDYCGEIFIDGINIKDISPTEIYENISISRQNPYLFNDTIYGNIILDGNYSENEINDAINVLKLNKLVQDNKNDISGDSIKNFSGGEKQRISLCRTILKKAPILLLDECTSQLDNETAFHIENYIMDMEEKTVIMILHRLNKKILEKADFIVLVENGKISKYGNCEEMSEYFY